MDRNEDIARIEAALSLAGEALHDLGPVSEVFEKSNGDPLTLADTTVNDVLLRALPRDGEGWLSEETTDDARRLDCERVWVVDPIDGTKEYVKDIPEWCISVGLVENGVPVAGGILSPPNDHLIVGSLETGVTLNGTKVSASPATSTHGQVVLASRSEIARGEWGQLTEAGITVQPMGSVAYKMGRVAAGLEAMTWTLTPKNEWDVAAGAALISANGGVVVGLDGTPRRFNQADPLLSGLISVAPGVATDVLRLLGVTGSA